jgi:hypothetical protein
MELLGVQDYTPLLDVPQLSVSTMSMKTTTVMASSDTGKDSSQVLNQQQPATPNSCSISSASSEAVNDNKPLVELEQTEEDDEGDADEKHQKSNKQWVSFSSNFLTFNFSYDEKG